MRFSSYLTIIFGGFLLVSSCEKNDTSIENEEQLSINIEESARNSALQLYQDYYLASANSSSDISWTGNEPSCTPGSVPQDTKDKILLRLDYYRKAAGLNNVIQENTNKSQKAQEAALMMHANGALEHFPPNSWKCYTEDGSDAAANSLLTSIDGASAIDSYIRDHGASNGPVGHRRWLLWPRLQEMGIGNTNRYNALWVIGNAGPRPQDAPEFVAWPPQGYIPKQVTFPRWSFSIHNADFTQTNVKMKYKNGSTISLETEELSNSFGDRTIVWAPNINTSTIDSDTIVEVTLENVVVNEISNDYTYEVIIFDARN
ncbi:CAP domain-containing protein [Euzebyella saccharophila]|uniref:CAP domain-containing protein n=1 Tax=Euzebyella saccharophila TaxID=679664 RepID=A0ABV8JTX5_9FLAO|nr:CAP domain-containing protein [Euzebyella saccharophila]